MRYQQIVHVVCVLFFVDQNTFHHDARGGILVGEETDEFAIVFTGDAFGDEVFPDHLHQVLALCVL